MAKKKREPERKQRTDAERRARQAERLSCVLRVLRCIMGPGRWDAEALARELEVSERTIHRILQTLSMAEVPWYFCKESQCYRVRPGFKFPGFELRMDQRPIEVDLVAVLDAAKVLQTQGEQFLRTIRQLRQILEGEEPQSEK